jgi:MerR family redox-sensitive transcriptional activator SoxR
MLTIGQVASRSGLRASAIRYYEERGLLPKASRTGGKRVYEASVLERLAVIRLAKAAGFNLDDIRATVSSFGENQPARAWEALASARRAEVDEEMKRLMLTKYVLTRMHACSCATLEECGRVFLDALSKRRPSQPIDPKARRRLAAKRLSPRRR